MKMKQGQAAFLGAILLAVPLVAAAQTDPNSVPANTPGMAGVQQPGSANNQMTPGISRPNRANGDASLNGEGGGPDSQMIKDKIFLRKAAQGGLAEVQLGQLAAQKGSSDEVKRFGQKMVDEHTALNESLKPFADSMGVMQPKTAGKPDLQEYEKLSSLSGTDFDKEYLTYMSADHHRDMREFREEAASTSDQSLKDAVLKARMVIGEHMRMVDKLAVANGISVGKPKP